MEQFFNVARPISLPLAIGAMVAGIITYWIARQLSASREELRVLRVALERDPSTSQLAQALRLWPGVAQYPPTHQTQEMVKRAHQEETRRAEKTEATMGIVRTFFALAALAGAIYVASFFVGPPKVG